MSYAQCSVILLVDYLKLNFYLNAVGYTQNDASVTAFLSVYQGISNMETMVYIRVGGTIVPWFG